MDFEVVHRLYKEFCAEWSQLDEVRELPRHPNMVNASIFVNQCEPLLPECLLLLLFGLYWKFFRMDQCVVQIEHKYESLRIHECLFLLIYL